MFATLFRASYWRMILRGATYREGWSSLRRAHKDKRARKHVYNLLLLLIIPFLAIAYIGWAIGTGAVYILPFVVPVIWWRSRREKQDATPLHIVPQPVTEIPDLPPAERTRIRAAFAEIALLHAILLDRAGSESFLKTKTLPEGFEVTSRRRQLDLLHSTGLWERLNRTDRIAMQMPDGHWDWAQINQVMLAMERLRLLRWMLRLDFYLPTVGQQLKLDGSLAHELVLAPEKLTAGKDLVDAATVRIGRDAAQTFYRRGIAEGISRGYYEASSLEAAQWAADTTQALRGKQHEDLVLGDKLVSEVSRDELLWATSLAGRRLGFLKWALGVLEGGIQVETASFVFLQPEPDDTTEDHV